MRVIKNSLVDKENLKKFMKKIKPEFQTELYDSIYCIHVDNTLSLLREVNIYLTNARNSVKFSIDELIKPLDDRMKLYINFPKKVLSLSSKQIVYIINQIKNIAPELFSDITKDEFIDTFDKFYEKLEDLYDVKNENNDEESYPEIKEFDELIEYNQQKIR